MWMVDVLFYVIYTIMKIEESIHNIKFYEKLVIFIILRNLCDLLYCHKSIIIILLLRIQFKREKAIVNF